MATAATCTKRLKRPETLGTAQNEEELESVEPAAWELKAPFVGKLAAVAIFTHIDAYIFWSA